MPCDVGAYAVLRITARIPLKHLLVLAVCALALTLTITTLHVTSLIPCISPYLA
ncbi:uncharacterized protein SCHCODRAFT_02629407 [Schizophyllum commune H4-8]|uniref:uncharacterized protein n=1 Tax=Schizophyllum commune (strain H4-8 / FGSC 9210) TaxID=578458 RepID=UPI00215F2664|nr:uncharacterized protein SCHCODRAFT_02629407 [Schizophyllum commune H4-8]KAI5891554.1 hypothetical protein SCHCODRAFT_02629407 [Schizophyllum commune H4-8]